MRHSEQKKRTSVLRDMKEGKGNTEEPGAISERLKKELGEEQWVIRDLFCGCVVDVGEGQWRQEYDSALTEW